MRKTLSVVVLSAAAVAAIVYLRSPDGTQSAGGSSAGARVDSARPAASSASAVASTTPVVAAVASSSASATPASAQPSKPEDAARLEAEAYPWDDFADVLGREISQTERDALIELRKEHGLRLAETRANMMRGQMPQAEFDAWKQRRAEEFRGELQKALGCSADEVTALLSVKMRPRAI